MPFSEFKTLWKGVKSRENLKTINVSYSKKLKKTPNFGNAKFVEKLLFRGCTSLQKVHPTIGELTHLGHLDLRECNQLIELPNTIGQLTKLGHLDMRDCVKLKRLPDSIKQLTILSSLDMNGCHNLKRLPEQLGDIKGLKKLDASYTAIEQLPDSITHLKELVGLKLYGCKKLKKLPEQFGNLEGLKWFDAGGSALEELPDSFVCLINLIELYLRDCSKLERLPEQIGKLQCLEQLYADSTAIGELPDSIGLLSRLKWLHLDSCKRLTYLPNSTGNLTSLVSLQLRGIRGINLPDTFINMKLEYLGLSSLSLWLPAIPTFSSLKELRVSDECQSFSKLLNLEDVKCKSFGSSLPDLPPTLERLYVYDHATPEQLPDLSSYEQLKKLDIRKCSSLQTLSLLPPHLEDLYVSECPSLQNLPDLSLLKELRDLNVIECSNLKSVSLKESSLQVGPDTDKYSPSFTATIPNREIAEWFSYKSSGPSVSFDIPPILGDNFLGVAFWVVYKFKSLKPSYIRAVITSKTEDRIDRINTINAILVGGAHSWVQCLSGEKLKGKSGDRINVSFQGFLYSPGRSGEEEIELMSHLLEVEKCGAHVIQNISLENISLGDVEKV